MINLVKVDFDNCGVPEKGKINYFLSKGRISFPCCKSPSPIMLDVSLKCQFKF